MQEEADSRALAATADAERRAEAAAKAAAEEAASRIKAEADAALQSATTSAAAAEKKYAALIAEQREEALRTELALQSERKERTRTQQEVESADAVAQLEAKYKLLVAEHSREAAEAERALSAEREERRRAEQRIHEQADARAEAAAVAEAEAKRQTAQMREQADASRKAAAAAAAEAKLQAARAKVKAKQEAKKAQQAATRKASAPPTILTQYHVVRKASIRAGFSTDSPQTGVLEANQIVDAIEVKKNKAGQTRVHIKQANGWVSTKSKSGKVLLKRVSRDGAGSSASGSEARVSGAPPRRKVLPESEVSSDDSGLRDRFLSDEVDAAKHRARRSSRRRSKPQSESGREHRHTDEGP
eukprot:COSAG06_NODE_14628_length_1141_cov_2.057582_1_plen_358_part_10